MSRQSTAVLRLYPSVVVWHFYSRFYSIAYILIKEQIFILSSTLSSLDLSAGYFVFCCKKHSRWYCERCWLILTKIYAVKLIISVVINSLILYKNFPSSSKLEYADS
jgi:hypothetical protein